MGRTMVRGGPTIDRDIDVPADDRVVLKGDAFQPVSGEACHLPLSYSPHAKSLALCGSVAEQ